MRGKAALSIHLILLAACVWAANASAQGGTGTDSVVPRKFKGLDSLVAWATVWGDVGRTGVYTCDEWKRYASKLFKNADRNRDGFVDAQEFKAIQQADAMLRTADLGYFDDNRDGRLSHSEFVDKPNPLFAQYDRKAECRVTLDGIADAAAALLKSREGRGGIR